MRTSRRRTDMVSPARADAVGGAGEDPDSNAGMPTTRPLLRVIDIGCAVGGIAFELTRVFDEVRLPETLPYRAATESFTRFAEREHSQRARLS